MIIFGIFEAFWEQVWLAMGYKKQCGEHWDHDLGDFIADRPYRMPTYISPGGAFKDYLYTEPCTATCNRCGFKKKDYIKRPNEELMELEYYVKRLEKTILDQARHITALLVKLDAQEKLLAAPIEKPKRKKKVKKNA